MRPETGWTPSRRMGAALSQADAARPADRLVAAAAAVLVVVGAGRRQERRLGAEPLAYRAAAGRRHRHARRRLHLERSGRSRHRRQGRAHAVAADPFRSGERARRRRCSWSLQALVGLLVLVQFNRFAIGVGIASLGVVAIYPFMKRFTYWPQIFLGLAFSWGALMGWAGARGALEAPAFLLYAGSIAWVIHYDTIYAHQDREDDALVGLKSTALLFGAQTKPVLALFSAAAVVLIGAGRLLRAGRAGVRARACGVRRASSLADRLDRYRRSGLVPAHVPLQPRCRPDPVRGAAARRCRPPSVLGAARSLSVAAVSSPPRAEMRSKFFAPQPGRCIARVPASSRRPFGTAFKRDGAGASALTKRCTVIPYKPGSNNQILKHLR